MAPRTPPTPATRLLAALLAADDPRTVRRVRRVLTGARTLDEAAAELGVSWRTAARWAARLGVSRPMGRPAGQRTATVA